MHGFFYDFIAFAITCHRFDVPGDSCLLLSVLSNSFFTCIAYTGLSYILTNRDVGSLITRLHDSLILLSFICIEILIRWLFFMFIIVLCMQWVLPVTAISLILFAWSIITLWISWLLRLFFTSFFQIMSRNIF